MARTKSSRSSGAKSARSSSSKSGSARGARASAQTKSESSSNEEGFSFARARDYVEDNVSLQTAGLALAGAGILALVSSAAGRSLIRTAATSVARLAQDNFGEYFGASSEDEIATSDRQRPSRQRAQDRI